MADLAFAAIMAIWGSSFAVLRFLLGGAGTRAAASPLLLITVRMSLASGVLVAILAVGRRRDLRMSRALLRDGAICGALLGVGFLLQIEGLQRTSASRSGFLTGLLVVFVPLLEFVFFRKKPPLPALVGLLLAFAGMTLLSAPWAQSSASTFAGDGLTVACAIVFAAQIIALGRAAPRHPVLPMLLLQLVGTAAICALAGPFVDTQRFDGGVRLWAGLVYLALFATLLAFGVQTWAQKVLPPVRIALLSSLEPVFAALWAAVFIGERLSGREFAGGALVIFGILVGEAGAALRGRKFAEAPRGDS